VARIRTPNALQRTGFPDHKAIMASSYRQVAGGVQAIALTLDVHSCVAQGRESPRASTVVTTGGAANIKVIDPENKYIQKYVLGLVI
jgi:hypothetical protein